MNQNIQLSLLGFIKRRFFLMAIVLIALFFMSSFAQTVQAAAPSITEVKGAMGRLLITFDQSIMDASGNDYTTGQSWENVNATGFTYNDTSCDAGSAGNECLKVKWLTYLRSYNGSPLDNSVLEIGLATDSGGWGNPAAGDSITISSGKISNSSSEAMGLISNRSLDAIDVTGPSEVTNISVSDNDTNPGADGRDFTVSFSANTDSDFDSYLVYIAPSYVNFDPWMYPTVAQGDWTFSGTNFTDYTTQGSSTLTLTGKISLNSDSLGNAFSGQNYTVYIQVRDTSYNYSMLATSPNLSIVDDTSAGSGDVIINEVNWAGSTATITDEWIELRNTSTSSINLSNWVLANAGNSADLILNSSICGNAANYIISAGGYYLIANYGAGSGSSRLNINPDCLAPSLNLNDNGITNGNLTLKDPSNNVVNEIDLSAGWQAGDATNKYSMEMASSSWTNAAASINLDSGVSDQGTPKAPNGKDTVSPTLSAAYGTANTNSLRVVFDEPVDLTTGEVSSNYSLSGGLTVASVNVDFANDPSGSTIRIYLASGENLPAAAVTVTVSNVEDLAGNPITPGSQVSFTPTANSSSDTTAPDIMHSPIGWGWSTNDITFYGKITDVSSVSYVRLYFREAGTSAYTEVSMSPLGSSLYMYTLDIDNNPSGIDFTDKDIEYYIKAEDAVGNIQTVPGDMRYGTGAPYWIARAGNTASGVTVTGANGAVTDGTSNIENSYVFIEGFGAPAVQTDANGAFTINNVPNGWFNFIFFATGYMPYIANGIDTNSNYTFNANSINFNSSSGDSSNPPSVQYTGPTDGDSYVPTDMYNVMIGFSEPMKSSTINSTNITMVDSSSNSVSGTVTYDSYYNEAYFQPDSFLEPSTTYTVTISTAVQDSGGTPLPNTYTFSFTTGDMYSSESGGDYYVDNTCPFIESTMPQMGAMSFATNGTLALKFSDVMDQTTLTSSNIKFYPISQGSSSAVSWSSSSYDGTNNVFSIAFSGLTANTEYELYIDSGSVYDNQTNGLFCGSHDFYASYTTASGSDSTSPQVKGHWPEDSSSGITLTTSDISMGFSEALNGPTITTTSVTISPSVSGTVVSYEPEANMVHLFPGGLLSANTTYTITINGNTVTDMAGNKLDGNKDGTGGDNYTFSFTTENSNSDNTPPELSFANADNFSLAVTFTEPMNHDSASAIASVTNPANYTLWSPWDSSSQKGTKLNIGSKTINWDGINNTAIIEDLSLNPGADFKIKVKNVKDLSSQAVSTGLNWVAGTIMDNADTFGMLGPGDMMGEMDFGMKSMGQMTEVFPMNAMAGVTTQYFVDIPLQKQIPDGGKIILTFPNSFDITNAAAVATTASYANQDINGPGSGVVTITSVTAEQTSRTITIVLDGATNGTPDPYMSFMDYLHFDLSGIVNSSIPKDYETDGYSVDVKTKDTSNKVLESLASAPIFISSPGTNRIWGYIETSAGDHSTALAGVKVYIGSPMTGPQEATTAASQDCDGDNSNETHPCYYFSNLPDGDFDVWIEPSFTVSGTDYRGVSRPDMIWLSSSNSPYTRNFTANPIGDLLKIAGTITGPTDEKIIVWTNNSRTGQWTEKEYTLTGGSADYYLGVDGAGEWEIGVDPWHPTGPMTMGPPPEPNFMPPSPIRVDVADAGGGNTTLTDYSSSDNNKSTINSSGAVTTGNGINFSLSNADQRITGYVLDASGNPIPNAEVWSYNPGGMGTGSHTQSSNDGSFSLKVGTGVFKVGARKPGMPFAPEKSVEVFQNGSQSGGSSDGNSYADVMQESSLIVDTTGDPSTASNPLVIRIKKSSYTISGKVLDSSDNVISGSSVWAWQENSPGHSETVTGSDGAYTLYVPSTGTWTIEADAPGYGFLGSKSVTVSSDNSTPSGQNFSPCSTIAEISGSVSGLSDNSGVNIWAEETAHSFSNDSFTDMSGDYTIRLEYSESNNTTYNIGAWSPQAGDFGKETLVLDTSGNISSGTTTFSVAGLNTITVNSQNSSGAAVMVDEMFIDFYDSTDYFGRHVDLENATSSTLSLPNGSYEIHAWVPGFAESDLNIVGDGIATSSGLYVLTVDGAKTVNVRQPSTGGANLRTITGTITSSGSSIENAWIWVDKLTGSGGEPTGVHRDTSTDASGNYSLSVADGYYMMGVDKPGYTGPNPTEIHVTADSSNNDFTLTENSLTISGRIWQDSNSNNSYDTGEGIESAWVWGEKLGGGWSGSPTEPDGTYNLSVSSGNWNIYTNSERYRKKAYTSNAVSAAGSPTGIDIQLTETRAVSKQRTKPVTPANGGTFDDKNNSGVKIVIPPNALGNDTNEGQIKVQKKNSVPSTNTRTPLGGEGRQINATDSNGRAVTNLSGNINIEIDITKTEVDAAVTAGDQTYSDIGNLTNGYWDDTKNNWVDITTTKTVLADGVSVDFDTFATAIASSSDAYSDYTITLKSSVDHLSDFAPLTPTDASAPSTPTGLSAAGSTSGTASVSLSWTANSEGDLSGYYVYRSIDGGNTYPLLTDAGDVTTYTDSSSLTADTTYYYKISAYDTNSNESTASSAVSATPTSNSGASGGGSVYVPLTDNTIGENEKEEQTEKDTKSEAGTTDTEETSQEVGEDSLIKLEGDYRVYIIKNNQRKWIRTAKQFRAAGYNWEDIQSINQTTFASFAPSSYLKRAQNKPEVYWVKNGLALHIQTADIFRQAGFDWNNIQLTDEDEVNAFVKTALVRVIGKPEVYIIENGAKRWIKTTQEFNQAGYSWSEILEIGQELLDAYADKSQSTPPAQPSLAEEVEVIADVLNVRSQGSIKGEILAKVVAGNTFQVLEKQNKWYKIKVREGLTGWVSGDWAE